ncbi:MAG: 7-cyano-7-deazaguanine synthase [Candidatus Diapherotrites archaeon]|nr:7-cyano-7-deazaguanine synthase [Candidatus Diapherotrites archaeon]
MKLLLLISGGIDSPVAGALALKAKHELVAVHFHNTPFTDELNKQKAIDALKILAKKFGKTIKLYIIPHGFSLTSIAKNCDRKMNCVLCRRIMLRVASRIAEQEGCGALLTGESLAQVASQTLWNLEAEHSAASKIIVRPLLGMDKSEITELAREFGTFSNSIKPALCCTIVPSQPATHSSLERAELEEKKLDLEAIVQKAFEGKEVIEIKQ